MANHHRQRSETDFRVRGLVRPDDGQRRRHVLRRRARGQYRLRYRRWRSLALHKLEAGRIGCGRNRRRPLRHRRLGQQHGRAAGRPCGAASSREISSLQVSGRRQLDLQRVGEWRRLHARRGHGVRHQACRRALRAGRKEPGPDPGCRGGRHGLRHGRRDASTVDLGTGIQNSSPSITWTTGAGSISVAQNSSLRLQGGVQINGAIVLGQGSNGFFVELAGGTNAVSGGVSCTAALPHRQSRRGERRPRSRSCRVVGCYNF